MAGVKGRSGGPRANSGGARPGAGRPPNPPIEGHIDPTDDPEEFLRRVMNDNSVDLKVRVDSAKALQTGALRRAEAIGKKVGKQKAAEAVAGKFTPGAPPQRLGSPALKVA